MNSAMPWNINGVGFDAREAAREAARRQGVSLGEWLHGVIADHAGERGSERHAIDAPERIEAITARLERMSAATSEARQPVRDRGGRTPPDRTIARRDARQESREDQDADRDSFSPRSPRSRGDHAEELLDKAVAAMDRRAARAERRTDQALASMAKLLDESQTRRDRERGDVEALTRKLGDLEADLSERFEMAASRPLEGSLSRLEARLDAIGRRGAAEQAARRQAPVSQAAGGGEPFRRLEDKLNTILDALQPRRMAAAEASAPAMEAFRAAAPAGRRSLGEAIAEIAQRQRTLEEQPPANDDRSARRTPSAASRDHESMSSLEEELRRIGDKVDRLDGAGLTHLHRQIEGLREILAASTRPASVERLEQQVADLGERLDRRLADLDPGRPAANAGQFDAIAQRLDQLAARLDLALFAEAPTPAPGPDTRHLEALIGDLASRFEAVGAPGADQATLDALQRQIERLSERFDRSESELSALPGLASSLRDLLAHLDATRASIETTAARAAHEVLRIAADDGRQNRGQPVEARTGLDTVQDMLGKVVERLAGVEREIADVRRPPAPVSSSMASSSMASSARTPSVPAAVREPLAMGRPKAPSPRPAAGADDIRLGGMEPRDPLSGARPPREGVADRGRPASPDDSRRADFIAAARRAAATAQAEAASAQRAPAHEATRAGLLAKSRDYVASHRRPLLMGLAAVLMALGTLVLVGRMAPSDDGADQIASAPAAPAKIASVESPARVERGSPRYGAGDLTPGALPSAPAALANPIPGSDPIQTGSISSLPSFAAGMGTPRPALPRGLVAAADGGDPAAQYALASLFAEGRAVPRDAKQANALFQKAADGGSAPAAYRLGLAYEKGMGVAIDKARAQGLYLKAAEAGNPRAMHNLAVMLADGDGHPDYPAAVDWFRKAAQYGVRDSQYNLGILLGRGLGVPQNLVQSYRWFTVAAAADDAEAGKKRDEVALKLSASDLAAAKAMAAAFQPKTPDAASVDVVAPPGGWDGAPGSSRLNSARSKISSL